MLAVEEIHFAYGDTPILNGLSLQLPEGSLVGVVGPNGAGKTTLLRLITGVLKPLSGRISFEGDELASLHQGRRARLISIVPQNPQLPLSFSVLDLVLMGRNPHLKLFEWEGQRDLDVASRAMELTGVSDLAERPLGTLSGGERQRAVVAMALAQEAPVLLLDEPTSNLDLAHQIRVMEMVKGLRAERRGAVLITMHDLTLAGQYCQSLIMLSEGGVYAEGPPEDVLTEENVSAVYGARVSILPHPDGGTPVVLPVSDSAGPHS